MGRWRSHLWRRRVDTELGSLNLNVLNLNGVPPIDEVHAPDIYPRTRLARILLGTNRRARAAFPTAVCAARNLSVGRIGAEVLAASNAPTLTACLDVLLTKAGPTPRSPSTPMGGTGRPGNSGIFREPLHCGNPGTT